LFLRLSNRALVAEKTLISMFLFLSSYVVSFWIMCLVCCLYTMKMYAILVIFRLYFRYSPILIIVNTTTAVTTLENSKFKYRCI